MDMEGARSSSLLAALFLTLVVPAASASNSCFAADDAAAAVEEDPLADEPYMLVALHNKDGEEIRLLADKGAETLSTSGFANRSGHWFYAIRDGKATGSSGKRRRRLPLPGLSLSSIFNMSQENRTEGLWNTLHVVASTSGPVAAADDDDDERWLVVVSSPRSATAAAAATMIKDGRKAYYS